MDVSYQTVDSANDKMGKTLQALKRDISGIRAGRANPQLLDRILVDYYGTPTPIHQMGNISSPEPRLLVISLWDPKMISPVEKAIQKSDLGINPVNDGKLIRLVFPELTEERRKELVKVIRKKGEEAKVAIRTIRRDANEQIKKDKKDSVITEDDMKEYEEDIQKLTDEKIKDVDRIIADKEKDIMEL
ncbi:MAG: ribosome recycling factor [Christensenellales bacterium]